jgi:hypothetical protein
LLSQTTIILARSNRLEFFQRYYEEYFAPLVQILVVDEALADEIACAEPQRNLFLLSPRDVYLEALDIRANLRLLEQYDAATGFDEVFDLTHDQSRLLFQTAITRGIDVTKNLISKNTAIHFVKRGGRKDRVFQSPNHALRLPPE